MPFFDKGNVLSNLLSWSKDNGGEKHGGRLRGERKSASGGHRQFKVQFVLVGATGAGKTKTIRHCFGHNGDLNDLRTSNLGSETSETVEFLIEPTCKVNKDSLANKVRLSVVDTPGFGDTRKHGLEQDARNLASISKFMQENCGELPNLVLLVLKADGNRDLDEDSLFAKSLKIYFDRDMRLTEDGSNVIVVLTHALSITPNDQEWPSAAQQRMEDVQTFVQKKTGWKLPVVILENKPEGSSRVKWSKEYSRLPNKTLQPKNLFDAMSDVFDAKDDVFGKSVTELLYSRTKKESSLSIKKGTWVGASLASSPGPRSELEERYYRQLVKGVTGFEMKSSLPPLDQDGLADRVDSWNVDHAEAEEEEPGEGLGAAAAATPTSPEPLSSPARRKGTASESDSVSSTAASSLELERHSGPLVGRQYSVEGDGKILDTSALNEDAIAELMHKKAVSGTHFVHSDQCNKNRVFKEKEFSAGGVSVISGTAESRGNHDNSLGMGSKNRKVVVYKVTASQQLRRDWHKEEYLSHTFFTAVLKLKDTYKPDRNKRFKQFFDAHGHGFVTTGYYGGELRIKREKSEVDRGQSWQGSASGSASAGNLASFLHLGGSPANYMVELGGQGSSVEDFVYQNTQQVGYFFGGDRRLHHLDKVKEWQDSIPSSPLHEMILDVKDDVMLYHNFLQSCPDERLSSKADAVEEAFYHLFAPTREEDVDKEKERNASMLRRTLRTLRLAN